MTVRGKISIAMSYVMDVEEIITNDNYSNLNTTEVSEPTKESKDLTYQEEIYFEGYYVNEDGSVLVIVENPNGTYSATLNLVRLTCIDDFTGTVNGNRLLVEGTDAGGNPISAEISINDYIVTLEITNTTWMYFQNGDQFVFWALFGEED